MAKIKAYKGFNKDMTCRGFQFEEGKEYSLPDGEEAKLCESGFHACENPLDLFNYYAPGGAVYHAVELDEVSDETGDDSKRCGRKIKIGARLSVMDICKLHFEYVNERTINNDQGKDKANLAAQDWSSLAAQDWSSLAARDWSSLAARDGSSLAARNGSSLAAQDGCKLSAGQNSVIAAFNSRAKGGMGTLIVLAKREYTNGTYKITDFKAAIVDGKNIKADTWYKLENGEFVEVTDK